MAESQRLVPFIHPSVGAAQDLRAQQYKVVNMDANGVRLSVANAGSGHCYILENTPNSGQNVTLNTAPNVTKAWAGGAIAIGQLIAPTNSAYCVATSAGIYANSANVLLLGVALTAASSGSLFDLQLF